MRIEGTHVIVTGAAGGIGKALAEAFHTAGARGVVVTDINAAGAETVAARLNGIRRGSALGIGADIGSAAGNEALIDAAQAAFGAVDLFFANAGVGLGSDLLSATDSDWETSFNVNVNAHIWAARRLMPEWLERGHGYFASTASAAGLLTQIGSAPYSVTKHAAVSFAEWLSVTYGDRGLRVSCLCPMGVNTNMLNGGDLGGENKAGDVVRSAGIVLEPADVAAIVVEAIDNEQFLILPHPQVLTFFQRKGADYDRWLAGMRRLQARVAGV